MVVCSSHVRNSVDNIINNAMFFEADHKQEIDRQIGNIRSDSCTRASLNNIKSCLRGRLDRVSSREDLIAFRHFLGHNSEHTHGNNPHLQVSEDCKQLMFHGVEVDNPETWLEYARYPETHPEFLYFHNHITETFNANGTQISEAEIKSCFSLLMIGVSDQLENPDQTENQYYEAFMNHLQQIDKKGVMFVETRASMKTASASLWSGGWAVSAYAAKNHRVLETSNMGHLFDNMVIHPTNWQLQRPLWPLLSKAFVSKQISDEVLSRRGNESVTLTYHARVDDPKSIAFEHEIPQAIKDVTTTAQSAGKGEKLNLNISLVPLINDGSGQINPVIPKVDVPVNMHGDWVNDLRDNLEPMYRALAAIIDINDRLPEIADRYGCPQEDLESLNTANSFVIGKLREGINRFI